MNSKYLIIGFSVAFSGAMYKHQTDINELRKEVTQLIENQKKSADEFAQERAKMVENIILLNKEMYKVIKTTDIITITLRDVAEVALGKKNSLNSKTQ